MVRLTSRTRLPSTRKLHPAGAYPSFLMVAVDIGQVDMTGQLEILGALYD